MLVDLRRGGRGRGPVASWGRVGSEMVMRKSLPAKMSMGEKTRHLLVGIVGVRDEVDGLEDGEGVVAGGVDLDALVLAAGVFDVEGVEVAIAWLARRVWDRWRRRVDTRAWGRLAPALRPCFDEGLSFLEEPQGLRFEEAG